MWCSITGNGGPMYWSSSSSSTGYPCELIVSNMQPITSDSVSARVPSRSKMTD